MVPAEAADHPMAKMLQVFAREGKKDIRRMPESFIQQLSGEIGKAFTWVASGDMADVQQNEETEETEEDEDYDEYEDDENDDDD